MSLSSGTRLGSYAVSVPIGAGGMGEVYRATDTRLGREVAIKVLPEAFASDPERLARFEREARLLASLNHPNIAHVYGFESATRDDDAKVYFLTMELVPGEDLAERLKRGAIPVDDAMAIARQIAEALEEAHEKGIVHRDLKPANVKLTPDGKVKVLDFGLAKAYAGDTASGSAADLSHSPTLAHSGTEAGLILGTAAYMSPEQARGKPVDKRADIWSFGVVLYEMLTGKRLFEGETASDTLAAVLRQDVDWTALPEGTPPAVGKLLHRSLARNPKDRLHDIGDARLDIQEALAAPEAGLATTAAPVPRGVRSPRTLALALGALVFLLAGAALGVLGARSRGATADPRPSFATRRLTELPGAETHPDISPDGRHLVYTSRAAGNADVYLLRIGGDRALNLTVDSPADDAQASISPDGEHVAFRSEREGGGLFVMGLTGESVRRVTDAGFDPAWSPDGRRLAYAMEDVRDPYSRQTVSSLWVADLDTGATRRLVETDAVQPAWSPDGRRIAYWANTGGQRDLWTVDAGGGAPVRLTEDAATDWSPEWSPDGRWLYFTSDRGGSMNLWRMAVEADGGTRAGGPEPVTTGVRSLGYARFSADGRRLVVSAYERYADLELFAVEGTGAGAASPRILHPRSLHWCAPSPDAEWLACTTIGTPEDVVLLRADGSELRRLTSGGEKDRIPIWSPDGRALAFYSTRGGEWDYWTVKPDGSGLRRATAVGDVSFGVWSPSGRELLVMAETNSEAWRIDLSREASAAATRVPLPRPDLRLEPLGWAADGDRILVAEVNELDEMSHYGVWDLGTGAYRVLPVPASGRGWLAAAGWLPDSRRVVLRSGRDVIVFDTVSGASRVVVRDRPDAFLRLSRNGRTLLAEREVLDADVWMLELAER